MAFLTFLAQSAIAALVVWLVFGQWRRLPLGDGETVEGRDGWLWKWALKGLVVPVVLWFVVNIGWSLALPPLLPKVRAVRWGGGAWGEVWLGASSGGGSIAASVWGAFSLAWLLVVMWRRVEDRRAFWQEGGIWGLLGLPVLGAAVFYGGWLLAGFGVLLWLAGMAHGALPILPAVRRVPTYSQAIARMKFGKYAEAEQEVLAELDRCKTDFDGWMLLAELYATRFQEFEQAEQTIIEVCEQPGTTASQVAVALHRLADWHLQLRQDPPSARRCLEAIQQRFPGTHLAHMAKLRSQRLPDTREELEEQARPRTLRLPALAEDAAAAARGGEVDPVEARRRVGLLTDRLGRHPEDAEARELLARDLAVLGQWKAAIEQLDALLALGVAGGDRRAEWLGLKAGWLRELEVKDPRVRGLLEQIVREHPNTVQAQGARRRLQLMEEEARSVVAPTAKEPPRIVIRMDDESAR